MASLFRIAVFFLHVERLPAGSFEYIQYAFLNRGLLSDAVVSSYIVAVPFLLLSAEYLVSRNLFAVGISKAFSMVVFMFLVLCYCVDIPYFEYYNSRLSNDILGWSDHPLLAIKSVFGDVNYYLYVFLFIIGAVLILLTVKRINRILHLKETYRKEKVHSRLLLFLVSSLALFIGIRGEYEIHSLPIGMKDFFNTPNAKMNLISVNPVYSFLTSFSYHKVDYFSEEEAIGITQDYLGIPDSLRISEYPLARYLPGRSDSIRSNIVIILLERMSAAKVGYISHTGLTPNIDSLAAHGIAFTNIYTTGMHTWGGIFSSLFSLPVYKKFKPMTAVEAIAKSYYGMPAVLKEKGYFNMYFCTNSMQFDNVECFLPDNGIDRIFDSGSYPPDESVNCWGISDVMQFNKGIEVIDSIHACEKPFMATFMTISTHTPYHIPVEYGFKPSAASEEDNSYLGLDWTIGEFMKKARQREWFSNTVFVLIADHGYVFDNTYEIPLTYHHSPLVFYAPAMIQPQRLNTIGSQMDLYPTLMGLTGMAYWNNTMGVDLLEESRPFAIFSADEKLGCIDSEYLLILGSHNEKLYKYKLHDPTDYANRLKSRTDSMRRYLFAQMQTMQILIAKDRLCKPRQKTIEDR